MATYTYLDKQVYVVYRGALNAYITSQDLNYWGNSGLTIYQISTQIFATKQVQYAMTAINNGNFIIQLYNNILYRQPDTGGYNYWVAQLNAGTPRSYVAAAFADSYEFAVYTSPNLDLNTEPMRVVTPFQQYFPFNPDYSTWEDWNGNFIQWYGQETIPHSAEESWQETAKQITSLPTFSAYPLPDPYTFETWQDWANKVTEIINGPSH
jgi:hypothetical protein